MLDGIDGCGKSTQAETLVAWLRERGPGGAGEVLHLREPGSTPLGESLRGMLLSRGLDPTPAVESLLFVAARRQMLDEVVAPALARGAQVVCERFHGSTFAYQAAGGGVPEGLLLDLMRAWAGAPEPDLTLWLDLDVERALARRGPASDRIEDKGAAYQRAVAEGFRRYAQDSPRVVRVDANGDRDQVTAAVRREVERVLA